ncbi:GTA-gp10 family protein [Aeribacillus pallidus]|uniref:GTA-gp10 family protein n=1 Tax=Aeribacillus pallidus TaxID=33936 RepID=UPI003D194106
MANKAKGIVKLNADYSLRYTTNALVELEETLGLTVPEILVRFERGGIGFKAIRTIVWAGLIHQFDNGDGTYDFTLTEAGDLIDELGFEAVMEKVTQALESAFPESENKPNRATRRQGVTAKN